MLTDIRVCCRAVGLIAGKLTRHWCQNAISRLDPRTRNQDTKTCPAEVSTATLNEDACVPVEVLCHLSREIYARGIYMESSTEYLSALAPSRCKLSQP
jgi:hypothetical protein